MNILRTYFATSVVLAFGIFSIPLTQAQEDGKKAGTTSNSMLKFEEQARRVSPVIPTPQESYWGEKTLEVGSGGEFFGSIQLKGKAEKLGLIAGDFARRLETKWKVKPVVAKAFPIVFALDAAELPSDEKEIAAQLKDIGPEGYVLKTAVRDGAPVILAAGNSETALWHAMTTLVQLITRDGDRLVVPEVEVVDYPKMTDRGLLVDIGGQGFMVGPSRWPLEKWKELVDWMVDQKLNAVWLEFIGSGRLMGNLKMEAGEWIGFPLDLKSYPQLVAKDRPIKRWDAEKKAVVQDKYTVPNVKEDFVAELIDYAKARGIKCTLQVGYDYFANQLPVVMGIPANDPRNVAANKVYDDVLREIVQRYPKADGVALCTIENKDAPADMVYDVIRRTNEAYSIIRSINPKMEVGLLADYIEWQPNQLEQIAALKAGVPSDVYLAYSPHREVQQRSWQRVHGDVWRYMNFSQYAWDHVAYIFPEKIQQEILGAYVDGYRKVVTQAWYFDVFSLNYLALAEYSWNPVSSEGFWDKVLLRSFGEKGAPLMKTALEHTRFDLRFDIIARVILDGKTDAEFTYWDMYVLHQFHGLKGEQLDDLEADAQASLDAATQALPVVPAEAKESVDVTIISAERRLYLARSARHLLAALQAEKAGDLGKARAEMDACVADGEKVVQAATGLGIEYPLAVHDGKLLEKYKAIRDGLGQPATTVAK